MRIDTVEPIPVRAPVSEPYGSARGETTRRETTLVRLETDTGTVGWGEAFAPPKTTATLIDEVLADTVVGMDPFEAESLCEHFYTHAYNLSGSAILQSAISGVDIAMWDIRGRETGKPVAELLGGETRETVTPYASTMYLREGDRDITVPVTEAVAEGFDAVKIKIGRGVEDDITRVQAARDVLDDDQALMVDVNGNYRPDQAIRLANELEAYDIQWLEEPVPPENVSGYRRLREQTSIPLAAGEAHYGRFEFKRFVDERCVDYLQPNVCRCGGFSEARRIADMAATENIAVRPHVWNSGIGLAAALQFVATVPNYPHATHVPEPVFFEFDRGENPLRNDIVTDPVEVVDGRTEVLRKSGIGVTVDETSVSNYEIGY